MAQIFPKWTNNIPFVGTVLAIVGGAVGICAVWYWASPSHTDVGYAPAQPIPYSHKLHAGDMSIDCRYCHSNAEKSAHAGVPPTQVCMNCHKQVKPDSPLLEPLRKSWADGTLANDGGPVRWKRVHKLPDYAYFNHSAHVQVGVGDQRAAVGCVECHGRIDQMVVVAQQQPLSMAWCLECHNDVAPRLRPREQLTNMGWTPSSEWKERAVKIATTLDPPGRTNAVRQALHDEHGNPVLDAHGHPVIVQRPTAGCTGCHR
jgi:hypothetical protein